MKTKFTSRKQKYVHVVKIVALGSVLLPAYVGLLGLGLILRTGLTLCGVSQVPPES